jgi:type II secretory pathway pseudopilin PulG
MPKTRPATFRRPRSVASLSGHDGTTLIEILMVVAMLALVGVMSMPTLFDRTSGLRLRLTAHHVAETLRDARSYAKLHNTRVAVKLYTQEDPMSCALYRDGDGDGVQPSDIESGTDPMVWRRRLSYLPDDIRIGLPSDRHPSGHGRWRNRFDDPIRPQRSNLIAFNPLGGATSGAVYLSDGRFQLAAVRLQEETGEVTVSVYDQN